MQEIEAICELARRHRLKTHLVGARLMANTVIKTGIAAHTFAAPFLPILSG